MSIYKTKRLVPFSKEDMEDCCLCADSPPMTLVNMFEYIYGEELWSIIKNIKGHPKVSKRTADIIIDCLCNHFPKQKQEIMMLWVNNGFSVDETVENWCIQLTDYSIIEAEQE